MQLKWYNLMWYPYIYSSIYLNNGKTYNTVYRFIKPVKKNVIFENADLIHYRTFIYIWETGLNIYSNYRTIEKDILNKFSKSCRSTNIKKKKKSNYPFVSGLNLSWLGPQCCIQPRNWQSRLIVIINSFINDN